MRKNITVIGFALFFTLGLFYLSFAEETFTITTYYPSPYGSYNELTTTGNTYLAINSGSNVGIGTTSPTLARLQSVGNALIGSGGATGLIRGGLNITVASNSNAGFAVMDGSAEAFSVGTKSAVNAMFNGGEAGGLVVRSAGRNFTLGTVDAFYLALGTNADERMRITSGGNVGIGTLSPNSKLDVAGYIQVLDQGSTPASSDCDAASEYGRMVVVTGTNRGLYVCLDNVWYAIKPGVN